jgi:hypothetical protein
VGKYEKNEEKNGGNITRKGRKCKEKRENGK